MVFDPFTSHFLNFNCPSFLAISFEIFYTSLQSDHDCDKLAA